MSLESVSMMAPGVAWDICWAIEERVGQPVQPYRTAAAFRCLGIGGNSQQLLALRCAKSNGTFAPVVGHYRQYQQE